MDDFGLGAGSIDRLLEDTRRVLEEMRPGDGEPPAPGELRGEGQAADGQVRAVAVAGGRLESLTVNPRAMRMGSEALCEQIVVAVNAALDDLRGRVENQAVTAGAVDPAALTEQMRDLHTESARQMEMFTQGIRDALDQISRSTRR
ncbi:MAG TPA: YbaB/EbfC family nucleoid-associated protein [Mycobacteriales bacterium]